MKEVFRQQIEQLASRLHNRLLIDADSDTGKLFADTSITPTEAKNIANDYVVKWLSQELYYSLNKPVLK